MNNSQRSFVGCMVFAVLLPFLSWVLSALGVSCHSILDGDGLRWLFRHAGDCLHSQLLMLALCGLMLLGVVQGSLLPFGQTIRNPRFIRFAVGYAVWLVAILSAASVSESPLLSITGGIAGSPLMDGLPFLAWLSLMVFCLCYGHGEREPWTAILTYGFRRYPIVIPFAIVLSFCWQCICYILDWELEL